MTTMTHSSKKTGGMVKLHRKNTQAVIITTSILYMKMVSGNRATQRLLKLIGSGKINENEIKRRLKENGKFLY